MFPTFYNTAYYLLLIIWKCDYISYNIWIVQEIYTDYTRCIYWEKAATLALDVNDITSSGISPFITIIILKYGAEYTRFTEARQGVNVRWRGNECIEFEWLWFAVMSSTH